MVLFPGRPLRNEEAVGEEHSRRIFVGFEDGDRSATLDQQGLVGLEALQRLDDRVIVRPAARRLTRAAVNDQVVGIFGYLRSRLFINMRMAASWGQSLQLSSEPRGARIIGASDRSSRQK